MSETKKQKRVNPLYRTLITVLLLLASGFFIYNIVSESSITYNLLVDLKDAQNEYDALLLENEQLTIQRDKLQDPNYVENYARGEYQITKEGEAIYHLPAQNDE